MEPHWTTYLTAMMTSVVACLAVWIAYQQWRTARDKLRLDLYDRRMAIYQAALLQLGEVYAKGSVSSQNLHDYRLGIAGAQWLFSSQVRDYLEKDFYQKLLRHHLIEGEQKESPIDDARSALASEKREVRRWFLDQSEKMDVIFYPYFGFDHQRNSRRDWFKLGVGKPAPPATHT